MKFNIMDSTGHSTEVFDKADAMSTGQAMARFKELTEGEKKAAFRKAPDGKGDIIRTFDPTADEITFVPQLVGG